jgi:hypothetical protein
MNLRRCSVPPTKHLLRSLHGRFSFAIVSRKNPILFTQWGILIHDQQIGHTMRVLGWLGMLATIAWLAWRIWQSAKSKD